MNDKIKDLLAQSYKTDSIAKNKWRIENREQLREQRKKELKELIEKHKTMSNNKTMVNLQNAKLIGTGEFVKGLAYQVYEQDEKYYSVLVSGLGFELLESTITEINFEDIHFYI